MSDDIRTTPSIKAPPPVSALAEAAGQSQCIEVEAIYCRQRLDGSSYFEVCLPDEPPCCFSVYLREKAAKGGLAQCVADFSRPDDAVAWARKTGAHFGLPVDVRFDLNAIKKLPIEVGEHVIVGMDFNAVCGTVNTLDDAGMASLTDCHDLFGPRGGARVPAGSCQRFWESPRMLGTADLIRTAAS